MDLSRTAFHQSVVHQTSFSDHAQDRIEYTVVEARLDKMVADDVDVDADVDVELD